MHCNVMCRAEKPQRVYFSFEFPWLEEAETWGGFFSKHPFSSECDEGVLYRVQCVCFYGFIQKDWLEHIVFVDFVDQPEYLMQLTGNKACGELNMFHILDDE